VLQYNSFNAQSWPKFQSGDSYTRNDLILNSTIVNDFQDLMVLTSVLWHHSLMKFSDSSRNNYMLGPSRFSNPLCSQLALRIYTATIGLIGGEKTDFVSGCWKPWVRHWSWANERVRKLVSTIGATLNKRTTRVLLLLISCCSFDALQLKRAHNIVTSCSKYLRPGNLMDSFVKQTMQ